MGQFVSVKAPTAARRYISLAWKLSNCSVFSQLRSLQAWILPCCGRCGRPRTMKPHFSLFRASLSAFSLTLTSHSVRTSLVVDGSFTRTCLCRYWTVLCTSDDAAAGTGRATGNTATQHRRRQGCLSPVMTMMMPALVVDLCRRTAFCLSSTCFCSRKHSAEQYVVLWNFTFRGGF